MKARIQFDEYVVAYVVASVDILGAKELITNGKGFEIIHKEYQRTIDKFNEDENNRKYDIGVKIFSDNILFYLKVPQYKDQSANFKNRSLHIMKLSASIKFFQNCLLLQNILVRGGITYGEFFVDDVMVWGKALIRAYELESKVAIYPRIILDPLIELDRSIFINSLETENDSICKDFDGLEFLNFISTIIKTSKDFTRIYDNIEREIERKKSNDNIVQKYMWLKNTLDKNINEYKENPNE